MTKVERNQYVKRPDQALKRQLYRKANRAKEPEYTQRWARKNPASRLFTVAKQRAKKYDLDFTITKEDIIVPECCPILGLKLEFHFGKGRGGKPNSLSLDRIDNNLGYIPGNIQVISHLANSMKSTASREELINFGKWITKTWA